MFLSWPRLAIETFATLIGRAGGASEKCSIWVNEDIMSVAKKAYNKAGRGNSGGLLVMLTCVCSVPLYDT
jgi:hypothetical protein